MTTPQAVYSCPRCGRNCTGGHCPMCASRFDGVGGFGSVPPPCNCGWDPPRDQPGLVIGRINFASVCSGVPPVNVTTTVVPPDNRVKREDLIAMLTGALAIVEQVKERVGSGYREGLVRRMKDAIARERA